MGIITENRLDAWVRGNAVKAQGVVVELIWRLVAASSPGPNDRLSVPRIYLLLIKKEKKPTNYHELVLFFFFACLRG